MPLIVCPECGENISSQAKQCPQCGLPTKHRGATVSVSGSRENATEVIPIPVTISDRIVLAAVTMALAPIVFFVPLIGLFAGPLCFIAGVMALFCRKEDIARIKGDCPYCSLPIESTFSKKALTCGHCKQHVIVKRGYFMTTSAATNPRQEFPDRSDELFPQTSRTTLVLKSALVLALIIIGAVIVVKNRGSAGKSDADASGEASAHTTNAAATRPPATQTASSTPVSFKRLLTVAEAQKEAMRLYPALGVTDSAFNRAFLARHKRYQQERPDYFRDSNWPLTLAREIASTLSPQ